MHMGCDNLSKRFLEAERLYHYTSFETACKIIETKKIKYGRLKNMNDINEAFRPGFWDTKLNVDQQSINKALNKFKQISFSIDKKNIKGFDIPMMWGHYADKGYGVCLVFDKSKIEELTKDNRLYARDKIIYTQRNPYITVKVNNIDDYLWRKKKVFFFKKTKDWEHEQEFRIITRNNQEDFLSYGDDALIAVIMCCANSQKNKNTAIGNSKEVKKIESIIDTDKIALAYYTYHNFFNDNKSSLILINKGNLLYPINRIHINNNGEIVKDIIE